MFVLTVDQRGSRSTHDRVPQALKRVNTLVEASGSAIELPFARTVGDEFQGLTDRASTAIAVARVLIRDGGWYVGIGAGAVDLPLPSTTNEASGVAYIHARSAIDDAKVQRGSVPISVRSNNSVESSRAQALLRLIGVVWRGRSELAWQAIDLVDDPFGAPTGLSQKEAAQVLGVSSAAISKRLKAASLDEERSIYPLLMELLDRADCA